MKTSKLRKLAGAFFALALGTTTLFAQGYRFQSNRYLSQENACLSQISDLTEEQKNKILELENTHQEDMAELRAGRRSTTNIEEKDEIRSRMLNQVDAHQKEVKDMLTKSQQKEYDLLHYRANNVRNNFQKFGQQNGNRPGYCRNGGQQFSRGNRRNCVGNQNRFQQRNKGQNFPGCPQNNQQRKGNGYGRNSSKS